MGVRVEKLSRMEAIYERPRDYDPERERDEGDELAAGFRVEPCTCSASGSDARPEWRHADSILNGSSEFSPACLESAPQGLRRTTCRRC